MAGNSDLKGKRVLVIGLARTGMATALFCADRGAIVTATDSRSAGELGESIAGLRATGVQLELGGHSDSILQGRQLVIPSPGVPADVQLLVNGRSLHVPVCSVIDL